MFSRAKSFWLFLLHATPILGATSFRGLSTSLEQYRCVAHCLLFSAENGKKLLCRISKAVVLDNGGLRPLFKKSIPIEHGKAQKMSMNPTSVSQAHSFRCP
jgi:hypothetical protein